MSKCVKIGLLISIAASFMRCGMNRNITWYIVGQALPGFGAPLVANVRLQLAAKWFSVESAPLVTSIFSILTVFTGVAGI